MEGIISNEEEFGNRGTWMIQTRETEERFKEIPS
jgi:hypothetical protein